jgi:hypothetical protein
MLRIKICTVGRNWCYLSDGIAVIPKQISVKKLKFLHNNKDIDKGDKGGNFFFWGGEFFLVPGWLLYSTLLLCFSFAAPQIPLCRKMLGLNPGLCDFDIDIHDTLTTWLHLI